MKLFILLFLVSCSQVLTKKSDVSTNSEPQVVLLKSPHILGSANAENTDPQKLHSLDDLTAPNKTFDIPVVYNKEVEKWVKYFTGRGREWFEKYSKNSVALSAQFSKILEEEGMPKDLIFLSMAESGFQNTIRSKANAVGAWQFMSFTGKRFGLVVDDFYDERRDPHKSARAAAQYLKELHELFGSWDLAMAAYNAGEGKIGRAIKRFKTKDFWKLAKHRYIKPETKNYVPKIMALAIIGKNLEHYGFAQLEHGHEVAKLIEVEIPAQTDLIGLCEELKIPFEEFQAYNSVYTRWHTPLELSNYVIKIPESQKELFTQLEMTNFLATNFTSKLVNKGTLAKVAQKERIPLSILEDLNPDAPSQLKETVIRLPYRDGQDMEDKMYADFKFVKKKTRRYYSSLSRGVTKAGQYIVQSGDTLWGIAKKLGVSYTRVVKLNGNRKNLRVGEVIALRD